MATGNTSHPIGPQPRTGTLLRPSAAQLGLTVAGVAVVVALVAGLVSILTLSALAASVAAGGAAGIAFVLYWNRLSAQIADQRMATDKKLAVVADAGNRIRRTLELVRTSSDPRLDTLSMNTITQNLSRIESEVSAAPVARASYAGNRWNRRMSGEALRRGA